MNIHACCICLARASTGEKYILRQPLYVLTRSDTNTRYIHTYCIYTYTYIHLGSVPDRLTWVRWDESMDSSVRRENDSDSM